MDKQSPKISQDIIDNLMKKFDELPKLPKAYSNKDAILKLKRKINTPFKKGYPPEQVWAILKEVGIKISEKDRLTYLEPSASQKTFIPSSNLIKNLNSFYSDNYE